MRSGFFFFIQAPKAVALVGGTGVFGSAFPGLITASPAAGFVAGAAEAEHENERGQGDHGEGGGGLPVVHEYPRSLPV